MTEMTQIEETSAKSAKSLMIFSLCVQKVRLQGTNQLNQVNLRPIFTKEKVCPQKNGR
jgi:hypothetical protein